MRKRFFGMMAYYRRSYQNMAFFFQFWNSCSLTYLLFSGGLLIEIRFIKFVISAGIFFGIVFGFLGFLDVTRGTYPEEVRLLTKNHPYFKALSRALYKEFQNPDAKQILEEWL